MKNGGPCEIPNVPAINPSNVFENAIRVFGVVAACEWFGYSAEDEFTKETIQILIERSNNALKKEEV